MPPAPSSVCTAYGPSWRPIERRASRSHASGARAESGGARAGEVCEQRFDVVAQRLVARAQLADCRRALGSGRSSTRVPHAVDGRPTVQASSQSIAAPAAPESALNSHARATCQSRSTVFGDTSQHLAHLLEREAAEEPHFGDPALSGVERRQPFERSVQIQQIDLERRFADVVGVGQRHPRPSA